MRIRTLLASCLIVVTTAAGAAAESFDRIVVFGDSLSDPGNHFAAFKTTAQAPFVPLPDASYARGGHHFSNGATWIEELSEDLDMAAGGKPALRAAGLFTNYAVGRARARARTAAEQQGVTLDLTAQVERFVTDFAGQAPSSALYVIWIGANDLNDALQAGEAGAAILTDAITGIVTNIGTLAAAGARHFLVLNIPDPTLAPILSGLDPGTRAVVQDVGASYNVGLAATMHWLRAAYGLDVLDFDAAATLADIVTTAGDGALANVTDSCLTFGEVGDVVCDKPSRYLFWDGAHPSRAGHRLLADAVLRFLNAE